MPNPVYNALEDGGTTWGESTLVNSTSSTGPELGTTGSPSLEGSSSESSGSPPETSTSSGTSSTGAPVDCVPSTELCDGVDNDCDGSVDEYSAENSACDGCTLREWGGQAYDFCTGSLTWFEARAACEERGASLVKIESEDEDEFIAETMDPWDGEFFWVGLNELDEEGTWVWTDGSTPAYLNFDDDQPDNRDGDQDCVIVNDDWFDLHCNNDSPNTDATGWVCEHS